MEIGLKPLDDVAVKPPSLSFWLFLSSPGMYFYTGPPNWVFSAFAFIGFVCSSIPLPWHLEGTRYPFSLLIMSSSVDSSVEHGDVSLHDLDSACVPRLLHRLDHLEW